MRKQLLTAALVFATAFINAQTLTSKDGTPILPEEGDWSISINAAPLGTLFRDGGPSALTNQYLQDFTIIGKMVKADGKAIRAKVRIGFGSESVDSLTVASGSTPSAPATVTDSRTKSSNNITLGGGIQKSRGKGRVQGFYGAEANVMFGGSSTTYDYGNPITATIQAPARADFGGNLPAPGVYVTENNAGSSFGFGVRGFIGAEYFFAAKMSLGVEYGWGLNMNSTGEGDATVEYFDPATSTAKTTSTSTGGGSTFSLDVDNASGAVFFAFYF